MGPSPKIQAAYKEIPWWIWCMVGPKDPGSYRGPLVIVIWFQVWPLHPFSQDSTSCSQVSLPDARQPAHIDRCFTDAELFMDKCTCVVDSTLAPIGLSGDLCKQVLWQWNGQKIRPIFYFISVDLRLPWKMLSTICWRALQSISPGFGHLGLMVH